MVNVTPSEHGGVDGLVVGVASWDGGHEAVVLDRVTCRRRDEDGAGLGGVVAEELDAVEGQGGGGTQVVLTVDDGLCATGSVVGDARVGTVDGHALVEGEVLFKGHREELEHITFGGRIDGVLNQESFDDFKVAVVEVVDGGSGEAVGGQDGAQCMDGGLGADVVQDEAVGIAGGVDDMAEGGGHGDVGAIGRVVGDGAGPGSAGLQAAVLDGDAARA